MNFRILFLSLFTIFSMGIQGLQISHKILDPDLEKIIHNQLPAILAHPNFVRIETKE